MAEKEPMRITVRFALAVLLPAVVAAGGCSSSRNDPLTKEAESREVGGDEASSNSASGQSPAPKTKTDFNRDWWVGAVSITYMDGSPKDFYMLMMLVMSENKALIEGLGEDSWEKKEAEDCVAMMDLSFGAEDGVDLPNENVKITGCSESLEGFLDGQIRLKGEQEWIRLGDFIEPVSDEKYRLSRCLRCSTELDTQSACPGCGAVVGP